MSNRRSRRHRGRPTPRPQTPPSPPQPPATPSEPQIVARRSLWERFSNHPVWWLLGAAATIGTILSFVFPGFSGVDGSTRTGATPEPFALRFPVTNESVVFSAEKVIVNCHIDTM